MRKRVSLEEVPDVMSVSDLQEFMGVSRVKAYEMVKMPGFPSFTCGRLIRIYKASFIKWLESRAG